MIKVTINAENQLDLFEQFLGLFGRKEVIDYLGVLQPTTRVTQSTEGIIAEVFGSQVLNGASIENAQDNLLTGIRGEADTVAPSIPTLPTTPAVTEYTFDQIALALATLRDKRVDIVPIIKHFNVQTLLEIDKSRYPELVQIIRQNGGAI